MRKISIQAKGNNIIEIGSVEDSPSVVVWFESENNSLVASDIKSDVAAIALAERIRDDLQVYVDIISRSR